MSQKYLTTAQVAALFHTNPSVIRASRVSGLLFGYPAPKHVKLGSRKILYKTTEIERFENQLEERAITF